MEFEEKLKKETYTSTEIIKLLRISRFTLYKYIYTGRLKAVKVGKKYVVFKKVILIMNMYAKCQDTFLVR